MSATCTVTGCKAEPSRYRKMCETHRHRQRKYGDPLGERPPHQSTLAERITAKVERKGPDDCWPYTGATQYGYGVITGDAGLNRKAHRVAYETFVGPIPAGLTLDHECHNRAYAAGTCAGGDTCPHRRCCNPAHLEPRTMGDNTARGGGLAPLVAYNEQRRATT